MSRCGCLGSEVAGSDGGRDAEAAPYVTLFGAVGQQASTGLETQTQIKNDESAEQANDANKSGWQQEGLEFYMMS